MGQCAGHDYCYTRRGCVCLCVYFCLLWGQRSSSRCSDRSTVCGVLQHQQPDRGQTVDLWCQRAEMTCFCHWVCAPSWEALNYIGTVLTDMFVIQSVLKIPSKGYYLFDKPLHSICTCVCVCVCVRVSVHECALFLLSLLFFILRYAASHHIASLEIQIRPKLLKLKYMMPYYIGLPMNL